MAAALSRALKLPGKMLLAFLSYGGSGSGPCGAASRELAEPGLSRGAGGESCSPPGVRAAACDGASIPRWLTLTSARRVL